MASPAHSHDTSIIGTIQSLLVAFVLAMTFRGFVVEGFVIPTGSMAPTLLGQHFLLHSDQTGSTYPSGLLNGKWKKDDIKDPMLGERYTIDRVNRQHRPRMGDRVLVVKSLYPFSEPDRFDVVVFKNPTNPRGDAANFIKRLIGLPGEKIWLADGDVFAGDAERPDLEGFQVQRKPEHVQRIVWQSIYHSDYYPIDTAKLQSRYHGPLWSGENWDTESTREYTCSSSEPTSLQWNGEYRPLHDWNPYNMLIPPPYYQPNDVSDIRLAAGVTAQQTDDLNMTLQLEARSHIYEFIIADGHAQARMKLDDVDVTEWTESPRVSIDLPDDGTVFNVEFWHVDQTMTIYFNGDKLTELLYDWSPSQRLKYVTGKLDVDEHSLHAMSQLVNTPQLRPRITWHFEGSPVTLQRVRLDRDLHYRVDRYRGGNQRPPNPTQPGFEDLVQVGSPAFGTDPEKLAILDEDQFMMLGDNSAASSDSRLWGNPHPIVAEQIDPAPFVVNRKLLLGKAWVVYFPAPYPISDGGRSLIPDFGRLRFIR